MSAADLQAIPQSVPVNRLRSRLLVAGLLVVFGGLCLAGWYLYLYHAANRQLAAALAETDRLDPGWRLHDLEARRAVVPDAENSAPLFMLAWRWRPLPSGIVQLDEAVRAVPAPVQLDERQTEALRTEVGKAAALLHELRKTAALPRGRHTVTWTPSYIYTFLPHVDALNTATLWLRLDGFLRLQDNDLPGALASCRAIFSGARSLSDEPLAGCQTIRLEIGRSALHLLERVLAQGEVSGPALADFQRALEEEDAFPTILVSLRGQRALLDAFMGSVQTGDVWVSRLRKLVNANPNQGIVMVLDDKEIAGMLAGSIPRNRAMLLRRMNDLVEIGKQPFERQIAELQRVADSPAAEPAFLGCSNQLAGLLARYVPLSRAELRCAAVALAAERYRLDHGRWPEAPAQLVPDYIGQLPSDPFDQAPLRYRRLEDGLMIYAIGPDGRDDGGALGKEGLAAPGTDLGFRLWDVPRRRQSVR
jgi:hypothetical protein